MNTVSKSVVKSDRVQEIEALERDRSEWVARLDENPGLASHMILTINERIAELKKRRNIALESVFDANVVANIMALVPVDDFEIDTLFGFTHVAGVKHYITYGGGPEGGYVYFASQRPGKSSWFKWHRDWFKEPVYTKILEGQVAFLLHSDGSEQITILPERWDTEVDLEALAETVIIADHGFMQDQVDWH